MPKELKPNQLVLCTVTKIERTTVFAKLDDYGIDGTLSFPEVAPGRIRNIREYAFPGKKIVCKVLSLRPGHAELSLRRVKTNERNEFNDLYKKERSYTAMLKTVLADKSEKIIAEIKSKEESLADFIDSSREDSSLLEKYIPKQEAEKIFGIIKEKKKKETLVSRKFLLSSKASDGIKIIKEIISSAVKDCKECEISYIAAGKYLIKIKTRDLKQGDNQLDKILQSIENSASLKKCSFQAEKH